MIVDKALSQIRALLHAAFFVHGLEVSFGGIDGNMQLVPYFLIGQPFRGQLRRGIFPFGQAEGYPLSRLRQSQSVQPLLRQFQNAPHAVLVFLTLRGTQ